MSDLVQSVTDGVVQQSKTAAKETSKNALGKDAFLQLLVTQMKYQDPLNPNTDTEYIAQLATFSQLEQLQNISTVSTNSQAFSLVGRDVVVKAEGKTGEISYISGRVDFVNMAAGKAMLSINDKLYPIEQLDSVIDGYYIAQKELPNIKDKIQLTYDGSTPEDLTFPVYSGSGQFVADDVAIFINETLLDSNMVSLSGNKVVIKKEALTKYEDGNYKITVAFNDAAFTTVKGKVNLQIKNAVIPDPGQENNDIDSTTPNDNIA
jgi:flagellar basal-body rod modification protein FlgD